MQKGDKDISISVAPDPVISAPYCIPATSSPLTVLTINVGHNIGGGNASAFSLLLPAVSDHFSDCFMTVSIIVRKELRMCKGLFLLFFCSITKKTTHITCGDVQGQTAVEPEKKKSFPQKTAYFITANKNRWTELMSYSFSPGSKSSM